MSRAGNHGNMTPARLQGHPDRAREVEMEGHKRRITGLIQTRFATASKPLIRRGEICKLLKQWKAEQLMAAVHAGRKLGRLLTRDPKPRAGARDWILKLLLAIETTSRDSVLASSPWNERDRRGTLAARQLAVLMRVDGGY